MSKTIQSIDLGNTTTSDHEMPARAKFLYAGIDGEGKLCVWMEVDDETLDREIHTFGVFNTGMPVPDDWTYCGSVRAGSFVLHAYQHDMIVALPTSIAEVDDLDAGSE